MTEDAAVREMLEAAVEYVRAVAHRGESFSTDHRNDAAFAVSQFRDALTEYVDARIAASASPPEEP
jgi:hypothetical protein